MGPSQYRHPDLETYWIIHFEGAWCHTGVGAAVVITTTSAAKYRYDARLNFALETDKCTNNIAEYEAFILGLCKLRALGVKTCIVKNDSKVIACHV
jgi:ribonuclease HI